MHLPPEDNHDDERGPPWLGLGVALLIVILGVWAMVAFKNSSDTLDCIASGRHNCVPVDQ